MWWLPLILFVQGATAGPFTDKTMRQQWAQQRIDQEWVLPKGWFELQWSAQHKSTTWFRNENGQLSPHPNGLRFATSLATLSLKHGMSDAVTLYLDLPVVHTSLKTLDDGKIQTTAFGDANAGLWVQPWRERRWAVAFQANLKTPSGVEWGQPAGFLTGTGLTNLTGAVHGRMKWTAYFSSSLSVGYTVKFPALVGYVIEDGGFGNGRLKAGNALNLGLSQRLQVHQRLSFDLTTDLSLRASYYIGAAGPGLSWYAPYTLFGPSHFLNAGGKVVFEPAQWIDLHLAAKGQVLGTDSRPFSTLGLEEFSPQPGWTFGVGGAVRW
jgi:hypothetical protein